jgi:hypothetical protein
MRLAHRLSVGSAAGALGVAGVATYAALRPSRTSTWGATDSEAAARMPGDEIVGTAKYVSTHAIGIAAPADEVWPWVVQLGQGRGGFYSYDWLENLVGLGIQSFDWVDPTLQGLAVGDVVRLVPDGTEPPLRFAVVRLEAPTLLVLGPDRSRADAFAAHLPFPCWTFQVTPEGADGCRLVVRFQCDFVPTPLGWLAYKHALQPVHFVMERKMLLGIKARAELATGWAPRLSAMPA